MNVHGLINIAIGLAITGLLLTQAFGSDRPAGWGAPMGPPPEAIEACKGKTEGDSVEFTTPRGDTVKGTCKQIDSRLAAMPVGGPGKRPDGPPPEGGD